MENIKCARCDKQFKRQSNLVYHMTHGVCGTNLQCEKSKDCKVDVDNDADNKSSSNHTCKYCGKTFTTATSMYRHTKHTCKIKKNEDSNREKIYERLLKLEETNERIEKENSVLKKKVVSLEKTVKTSKTVNNIINNTNNTNNGIIANINLIGYGQEDISKIDRKDLIKAIQQGFNSTIKLTETLHFNPKHPEYHNVYITNMRDKYAMMFDGKDWNLIIKDELINKIYDDKKHYIEENMDEFIDSLSASRKRALDRWLETDDEDEKISRIKGEIKLLLYNKRNLVVKQAINERRLVSASRKSKKDDVSDGDDDQ